MRTAQIGPDLRLRCLGIRFGGEKPLDRMNYDNLVVSKGLW